MRALILILCLTVVSPGPGNSSVLAAMQGDGHARQALERALLRLGGSERLQAIRSLYVQGKGSEYRSADVQGPDPETPTRTFHEETFATIPAENRILYEHRTGRHDGSTRWRRWMYNGEERTVLDFRDEFISNVRRDPSAPAERRRMARTIPHLLLLEVAQHADSLRWIGNRDLEGRSHDVIGFALPGSKTELTLFFASDTHLLSKFAYAMDFPGLGDTVIEFVYPSYRREAKLGWVPAGYMIKLAGKVYREIDFTTIEADTEKAAAALQISAQMASFIQPVGEAIEVAKGVYLYLNGSLNPMFIEFKDFVLVAEAPAQHPTLERIPADTQEGSDQVSQRFIRKIKETIPGKPIRYLAVTHFHSDHAGGARAFWAEGATLLTTPGNRAYFERLAAAKYAILPDRYSKAPRPPQIEPFTSRRVITDGERTVELINIGPSPHAKENVVVYLPKEKILYQGDLFYFNLLGQFPAKDPSRDRVMKSFANWLVRSKLPVERIYGFHDRGFATMTQVRTILNHKRPADEAVN